MSIFRFQQFSVSNERSAMKVNTDGVLLGAAMTLLPTDRHLLDIGTGTGTIALMAAQRLSALKSAQAPAETPTQADFLITAIDIDEPSASEAIENFQASPWSQHLVGLHISLQNLPTIPSSPRHPVTPSPCLPVSPSPIQYDLIFSNPPYFDSATKAPDERRATARQTDTLSYRDIICFAAQNLAPNGRVALILPAETERELRRLATSFGLSTTRILRVQSTPNRPISRIVIELTKSPIQGPVAIKEELLCIQKKGAYSEEYRSLTKEFLLI